MSEVTVKSTPDEERQWAEFARKYGADKAQPSTSSKMAPVEEKKQRSLIDLLRRRNEQLKQTP